LPGCRLVNAADFFARWRVRLSYPLAVILLLLANPTPGSIVLGAVVGSLGLLLRASAAGHLHKQTFLSTAGPYAYTRNPLYLGSAVLTLGAAIAMRSWLCAIILGSYFGLFYWPVMRREEQELRLQHGAAFEGYARAVPLFFPRLSSVKLSVPGASSFSSAQYKRNREYRAALGFLLVLGLLLVIWRLRLL
jgi:protein-S-isoprenylcysteine O-methyltransferase Ste14